MHRYTPALDRWIGDSVALAIASGVVFSLAACRDSTESVAISELGGIEGVAVELGKNTYFFPSSSVWWPPVRGEDKRASVSLWFETDQKDIRSCFPTGDDKPMIGINEPGSGGQIDVDLRTKLGHFTPYFADQKMGRYLDLDRYDLDRRAPTFLPGYVLVSSSSDVDLHENATLINCDADQNHPVTTCTQELLTSDANLQIAYLKSCVGHWKTFREHLWTILDQSRLSADEASNAGMNVI